MKISYSAPAKVILSGEHAVVYGKQALVSAIDLRLKFTITNSSRSYQDSNSSEAIHFISQKIKDYLRIKKIDFMDNQFDYIIQSEIPVGRGLGSSAALSVTSAAAFLEFYTGKQFKKETVNELAFQIEKHFHQNPSGVDNSAACFGGMILFQKQVGLSNIKHKIPKNIEEKLFLIDSGKPKETTGEMVKLVEPSFAKATASKSVKTIFSKIEIETGKMLNAIEKENIDLFKECLTSNEKLLEDLGVVSDKTKKLLISLSKFGVGKVTGAGGRETGSGYILFFTENKKELVNFLRNNKIKYFNFTQNSQGLARL